MYMYRGHEALCGIVSLGQPWLRYGRSRLLAQFQGGLHVEEQGHRKNYRKFSWLFFESYSIIFRVQDQFQ